MTPTVDSELSARIVRLERRYARRWPAITLAILAGASVGWFAAQAMPANAQAQKTSEILTVRGLSVVDERGVERVRIGSPLPDPMVEGKRVPRQGVVSGILIFDTDGDERGGYVTSDINSDAFLTLDAKKSQQALFLANPDGGPNLSVWSGGKRGVNYVSVRAVPIPLIEIVQDGKRVFTAGGPDAFMK